MDSASSVADAFIASLGAAARRVAPGEWGVSLQDVAGWPLHVGIRLRDGFLRAQAEVCGAGQVGDHELLARNRLLPLVRLAHPAAGDVWIVGELPEPAVRAPELDRLLGLLVAAATEVRERAPGARSADVAGLRRRAGARDRGRAGNPPAGAGTSTPA